MNTEKKAARKIAIEAAKATGFWYLYRGEEGILLHSEEKRFDQFWAFAEFDAATLNQKIINNELKSVHFGDFSAGKEIDHDFLRENVEERSSLVKVWATLDTFNSYYEEEEEFIQKLERIAEERSHSQKKAERVTYEQAENIFQNACDCESVDYVKKNNLYCLFSKNWNDANSEKFEKYQDMVLYWVQEIEENPYVIIEE